MSVAGREISVLGPIEVRGEGSPVPLGGPKQRAVLALLVTRLGKVVTTDELIDGIWGDDPPGAVHASLHTYVSNLRAGVGYPIARHGSGYLLEAERSKVDAYLFEDRLDESRQHLLSDPQAASDGLRRALALWRGRAYADVVTYPGLLGEATRLEELRLAAVEDRIEADLALGRHGVLVGELEALAAEYPLRESVRAKHMLALYRDGRQADALRAFRRTQEYLREELGIDPSPELQDLEERILNHDHGLLHSREAVTDEVALVFTDIASAAQLWEECRAEMRAVLPDHDELLRSAIEEAGGSLIKSVGGGCVAAFGESSRAVHAAVAAQRSIAAREWPVDLRVRMAVDCGEVEQRGGDLFGPPVNRGSRLLAASHGGQILLSVDAQRKLGREPGIQVKNLGEHRFRGLHRPQEVFQLVVEDLPSRFPALATSGGPPTVDHLFGDVVAGYELRERLGESDVAVSYRAYQASMGREVAIKIFRPEVAGHPAFVRSFETQSRLVASLEHPHIVSVYDYWRDAAGAYLVTPYLAGGNLADRLVPQPLAGVAEIAGQVGAALSHAHRHGVLHLRIQPGNILFDRDGNAYLADFGSAVRAVEEATGSAARGGYRAPEDQPDVPIDERADLYSLAAVIARLLTGGEPPHFDLSGVDPRPRRALERALAPQPGDRPAGVEEFVEAIVAGTGVATWHPPVSFRNPYKGLSAFTEPDRVDFCGRDREIRQAMAMITAHRLSAVVGPSGSGKSSLVLAGLLANLQESASPSERWVSVRAVPGRDPFEELAVALAGVSTLPAAELARRLAAEDDRGLLRVTERICQELDAELAVVIDQFEELFTLVPSAERRDRFVAALVAATSSPHSRMRAILTLRADFFHEALSHPALGPVITGRHLALAPLDRDGLHTAITEPAVRAGLQLEPGLAERMVADVADQAGSLPLLEFTLHRLAAATRDGRITHAGYDALGGVRGAIADRAEAAYRSLNHPQRDVARHVFTRLLVVSDEVDDLRRRVRVSEFRSLGLPEADVEEVLATFGRERLLTFDVDPITRGATVEVAHEALLREWPTLLQWVEARRESLVMQRRFQTAHAEWEESGRRSSDLLMGGRLEQFEEWAGSEEVRLTAAERRFLEAAVARRDAERAARQRRRRRVLAGFGAAAVVAVVLALVAVGQRAEAERSTRLAEARSLVLGAEGTVDTDPELSVMLSLGAVEAFRAAGREPPVSAVATLRQGVNSAFVEQRLPGGRFVAVSADGAHIATKGEGEQVTVWERGGAEPVAELAERGGIPFAAAFVSSHQLVVAYTELEEGLVLWDYRAGEVVAFGGPPFEPIFRMLDTTDGGLVAVPRPTAASVEVWSAVDRELLHVVDEAVGPSFSDDGKLHLLHWSGEPAGWRGAIRVVDAETGRELDPIPIDGLGFDPEFLALAPDGSRAALVGDDRTSVAAVDLQEGTVLWTTTLTRAYQPRWLPDGERILVGGETSPHLLDARSGEVIRQLHGAVRGGIGASAPLPGTNQVAAAGWSAPETVVLALPPARSDYPTLPSSFAYGPGAHLVTVGDGSRLAVSDEVSNGLIDADTGRLVAERPGEPFAEGRWNYPVFSTQGHFAAGPTADGRSVLWSNVDRREVYVAPAGWKIRGVSDDGSLVVVVDLTARPGQAAELPARLVRTEDGSTVANLAVGSSQMPEAVFSPDGTVVLTNKNEAEAVYRLWDTSTGELLREIETSVAGVRGWNQRFTPDGTRLVVGGYDGTIWVLEVEGLLAGRPTEETVLHQIDAHNTFITHIWVSDDGAMFLSESHNEPLKVWDLETGEKLGEYGTGDRMVGDFHPTEPLLYVPLPGDRIGVYTLDLDDLLAVARTRLTRHMTEQECQEYLGRACEGS